MSVIMLLRVKGDARKLEERAAENPDAIRAIGERAKEHGAIAHRFYGNDDEILVADEWPDPESFHRFFEAMQPEIGPLMQEVGATTEPDITFWRKLDSHDEFGWGA